MWDIWGSHNEDREDGFLLEYYVTWLGRDTCRRWKGTCCLHLQVRSLKYMIVNFSDKRAAFISRVKDYPNFLSLKPEYRCSTSLLNAVKYLPNLTLLHPSRTYLYTHRLENLHPCWDLHVPFVILAWIFCRNEPIIFFHWHTKSCRKTESDSSFLLQKPLRR